MCESASSVRIRHERWHVPSGRPVFSDHCTVTSLGSGVWTLQHQFMSFVHSQDAKSVMERDLPSGLEMDLDGYGVERGCQTILDMGYESMPLGTCDLSRCTHRWLQACEHLVRVTTIASSLPVTAPRKTPRPATSCPTRIPPELSTSTTGWAVPRVC